MFIIVYGLARDDVDRITGGIQRVDGQTEFVSLRMLAVTAKLVQG